MSDQCRSMAARPRYILSLQWNRSLAQRTTRRYRLMEQNIYLLARITSAAFSPIIYTALTMKNPGIRGKTEASTTRSARVPCTRKSEDNTPPLSLGPIGHVQEA